MASEDFEYGTHAIWTTFMMHLQFFLVFIFRTWQCLPVKACMEKCSVKILQKIILSSFTANGFETTWGWVNTSEFIFFFLFFLLPKIFGLRFFTILEDSTRTGIVKKKFFKHINTITSFKWKSVQCWPLEWMSLIS